MPLIHAPDLLRATIVRGVALAFCAAVAASPVPGQEGTAAAADAPQAGNLAPDGGMPTGGGIDHVMPQRAITGLQRRANVRALIAHAPGSMAGIAPPMLNPRIAPLTGRPGGIAAAPRNAIGIAMPAPMPTGLALALGTPGAGLRLTGIGAAAGVIGNARRQMPIAANLGVPPRGAALNGTSMGRLGPVSGSIGGPARNHAGINGTLMRPRY